MRIGQGYDIHRLEKGLPLIIGGVEIPFEKGLLGHSDADVLIHAVTDSILGASGLGDIGKHFPDNNPDYRNKDSRYFLRSTINKIHKNGFKVLNVDSTIVCERPKLQNYINDIKSNLSEDMQIDISFVNVKAKTNEKLGYIGSGDAIMAQAISLLTSI